MIVAKPSPSASRHVPTQIEPLEVRALLAVTSSFVEVPISSAAIAADPQLANHRTFDLKVHLTAGDRFNVAGFDAVLSQGEFYRFGTQPTTNAAGWPPFPQSEFATFVCVNDYAVPSSGVLTYVTTLATPVLTGTRFQPAWGHLGGTPPDVNDFTVARITVPINAVGTIYGEVRSIDVPNRSEVFVASLPVGAVPLALARGAIRDEANQPQAGLTVFDDVDNDATLDSGEATTITDSNGRYQLLLPPGLKRLRAVLPANLAVISPASGMHAVGLVQGQWHQNLDFTVRVSGTASIAGRVLERPD